MLNFQVDTPLLNFPFADHPELKYPLEKNEELNRIEEKNVLSQVRAIIKEREANGKPVVAVIIEPVQSEGGDRWATDSFYRNLRQLCLDEEVSIFTLKNYIWELNKRNFSKKFSLPLLFLIQYE